MGVMGSLYTFFLLQANQPTVKFFTLKDPDPEPSFVWFILNAFFFVGVVALVTLGLGIAFGGFRMWLLTKFPHNRLNGADEDSIVHTFRLNDLSSPSPSSSDEPGSLDVP